ncbi:LrgB family protein [Pseudomonas tohonis]|uniref:LrgB family protein n=1 Tax=Pseudomonas tohonis TaxID=2725477 RepID=UPI0021D7F044|nr:LrgB family protein [Pseudomonas tohonis]UXY51895.1 LrgB family protein [Pseudomonas tohonis]
MSAALLPGVSDHPLFHLALTLGAYQLALLLFEKTRSVLAQPVLVATLLVVAALLACGIDYATYRSASSMLWLLLGPATVALAVPLYRNLPRIRQLFWPVLIALAVGGTVTLALTLLLAHLLGAGHAMLMTLAPKSVTSPIAILVAEQLGGSASLAAVFVMITGVLGAALGPALLRLARVTHPAARGLALGLSAHAVGTAQALQENSETGAFAALAMSLAGVATAVLLPVLLG